jgi:hypothetical protein
MILRSKMEQRTWLVQDEDRADPDTVKLSASDDEDGTIFSLSTTSTVLFTPAMLDDMIEALEEAKSLCQSS